MILLLAIRAVLLCIAIVGAVLAFILTLPLVMFLLIVQAIVPHMFVHANKVKVI